RGGGRRARGGGRRGGRGGRGRGGGAGRGGRGDGRRDRGGQGGGPLGELRAVRHLLRQGMPECVLGLREERGLVQELGRHERAERGRELGGGQLHHRLQDGLGELLPDHRRGLQYLLLTLREAIDARGEHRLHRRRDGDLCHRPRQAVRAPGSLQGSSLQQRLHDLLD